MGLPYLLLLARKREYQHDPKIIVRVSTPPVYGLGYCALTVSTLRPLESLKGVGRELKYEAHLEGYEANTMKHTLTEEE